MDDYSESEPDYEVGDGRHYWLSFNGGLIFGSEQEETQFIVRQNMLRDQHGYPLLEYDDNVQIEIPAPPFDGDNLGRFDDEDLAYDRRHNMMQEPGHDRGYVEVDEYGRPIDRMQRHSPVQDTDSAASFGEDNVEEDEQLPYGMRRWHGRHRLLEEEDQINADVYDSMDDNRSSRSSSPTRGVYFVRSECPSPSIPSDYETRDRRDSSAPTLVSRRRRRPSNEPFHSGFGYDSDEELYLSEEDEQRLAERRDTVDEESSSDDHKTGGQVEQRAPDSPSNWNLNDLSSHNEEPLSEQHNADDESLSDYVPEEASARRSPRTTARNTGLPRHYHTRHAHIPVPGINPKTKRRSTSSSDARTYGGLLLNKVKKGQVKKPKSKAAGKRKKSSQHAPTTSPNSAFVRQFLDGVEAELGKVYAAIAAHEEAEQQQQQPAPAKRKKKRRLAMTENPQEEEAHARLNHAKEVEKVRAEKANVKARKARAEAWLQKVKRAKAGAARKAKREEEEREKKEKEEKKETKKKERTASSRSGGSSSSGSGSGGQKGATGTDTGTGKDENKDKPHQGGEQRVTRAQAAARKAAGL